MSLVYCRRCEFKVTDLQGCCSICRAPITTGSGTVKSPFQLDHTGQKPVVEYPEPNTTVLDPPKQWATFPVVPPYSVGLPDPMGQPVLTVGWPPAQRKELEMEIKDTRSISDLIAEVYKEASRVYKGQRFDISATWGGTLSKDTLTVSVCSNGSRLKVGASSYYEKNAYLAVLAALQALPASDSH